MNTLDLSSHLDRPLRHLFIASVGGAAVLAAAGLTLGWHRQIHHLDDVRAQLFLTCASLAFGAAAGGSLARSLPRHPRHSFVFLAAIVLSQACFLLLVWTPLKAHDVLWRAWWVFMITSVALRQLLFLRDFGFTRRRWLERITAGCVVAAAGLLMSLAFRADLFAPPDRSQLMLLAGLGGPALAGLLFVRWAHPYSGPDATLKAGTLATPVPARRSPRLVALALAQPALLLAAFYFGRITAPTPSPFDWLPSTLAQTPPAELDAQLLSDFARLKTAVTGLEDLGEKLPPLLVELRAARTAGGRDTLLPAEEDRLQAHFQTFLAYRTVLLRLVAAYAGFESVRDPAARARCFLTGYAAGSTLVQASQRLVTAVNDDSLVRRKLNEPDAASGIPAGMLDRMIENLAAQRNQELFAEMAAYWQSRRGGWRQDAVLPAADLDWFDGRVGQAVADIQAAGGPGRGLSLEYLRRRVTSDGYTPVYTAQSIVSSWIGDTRILQRPPCITLDQIRDMQTRLEPGDILLERRNWFLSNAFLPGFWPHAALYVGNPDDLARLGVLSRQGDRWTSDDPEVASRLPAFLAPAPDGEPHTVIEAVSEGVVFSSLAESMHADHVAVLRPRLPAADRARAIRRAFAHQGKPYDFDFDFTTADKLVCSELIYRVYDGRLRFSLVKVMGRDVLPALEIGRAWCRERDRPDRQLDFILFLDGTPSRGTARLADEDAFCASLDRPRGFQE